MSLGRFALGRPNSRFANADTHSHSDQSSQSLFTRAFQYGTSCDCLHETAEVSAPTRGQHLRWPAARARPAVLSEVLHNLVEAIIDLCRMSSVAAERRVVGLRPSISVAELTVGSCNSRCVFYLVPFILVGTYVCEGISSTPPGSPFLLAFVVLNDFRSRQKIP